MAKRPWLNCILSLGLALSLSACGQPPAQPGSSVSTPEPGLSQPEQQTAHSWTLAAFTDQSFHPILSSSRTNLTLAPLMYEGLFQLDTSFAPQPVLCSSYETSEDGLVWTFTLHPNITFSDGTPLTAPLVVQALELARTGTSPYSGRFSGIASISAPTGEQLVITLTQPNTALPSLLDIPIPLDGSDRPLGTGPYVLTQGAEDSLSLNARTDWWQGRSPSPNRIQLLGVTQPDTLKRSFERGALSLVNTDPTATDAAGYSGTYQTTDYDTTSLVYLGFNAARSPLYSVPARRAVAAALDRSQLVSAACSGHARAAALPIHPASPLYNDTLARQLPGPEQAQELMEQAGLSGRRLTLLVNRENSSKVTAAQLIARQLEKAGLSVTVSSLPWADYTAALSNGQFDLYLGEVTLTADFDLTPLVGSGGAVNYSRWRSTQADSLLRACRSASVETRPSQVSELCSLLTSEMPLATLYFERGSVLTQWGLFPSLTPTRANVFFGLY